MEIDMEINAKTLAMAHEDLMTQNRCTAANFAYVSGKNPKIVQEPDKPKPDNRIPVPMAKMAVMTVVGYAGRPGDITTKYIKVDAEEEDAKPDDYQELIASYAEHNQAPIENTELLTVALSQGSSWELWWQSEGEDGEFMPEYKIVPYSEAYPIYDNKLKPTLEALIRFWEDGKDEIADVYMPFVSERWVKKEGEMDYRRDEEGDSAYAYSTVPAIPFLVNMTQKPIYEAEKPIIDSFDSAISKSQNEVDRFNAAILMTPAVMSAVNKAALAEGRQGVFDNLEQFEKWPEYLQKTLTGVNEFYKNQTANLERLFHKSIGIPDISDENFAGNQSGVAIAYKLIPLEFLVTQVEGYFRTGLMARKSLYDDFIKVFHSSIDTDGYKVVVDWKRNIPVDDEGKVKSAAMLSSILSPEGVLEYLPNTIVADPARELIRIEGDPGEPLAGLSDDIGDVEEAVKVATLSGIQIEAANTIIQSVAAGALTREAAINQLIVFLGLSRDNAEKVMQGVETGDSTTDPGQE